MGQDRSRHAAPMRRGILRWNRGDLAILVCGFLAFLSFTFGAPLFQPSALSHPTALARPAPLPAARTAPAAPAPSDGGAAAGAAGPAQPAEAQTPSSSEAAGPEVPAAAPPIHIRYPSAAFDVAIHPLDLDGEAQSSRTIEPPATKDGYWLTPFGVPGKGSGNTTYVIGHSWEGADAPFNHLSSAAAVGDHIEVETAAGTISYRVDSITTYLKSGLKDSAVWDMVPNRLVLISCYTEDPWGKNVVVTAYPADPQ
ncbi:class F sortase [Pseudarthrobacter sp. NPDC080039]|uniref:class F sortase n=1 Tax=unclassified Pseudarthrobacter TaxID=2647000 RepID=UPI00344BCD31